LTFNISETAQDRVIVTIERKSGALSNGDGNMVNIFGSRISEKQRTKLL